MLNTRMEDLITGNEEIDNLQDEVFQKYNALLQAVNSGQGSKEIGKFIWFLKRYIRKHFQYEENLQRSFGFPDYANHKAQHDAFSNEVRQLENLYTRATVNTVLVVTTIRMMSKWIMTHISQMDVEAASFFRRVLP